MFIFSSIYQTAHTIQRLPSIRRGSNRLHLSGTNQDSHVRALSRNPLQQTTHALPKKHDFPHR